jgi:hypothetical protein
MLDEQTRPSHALPTPAIRGYYRLGHCFQYRLRPEGRRRADWGKPGPLVQWTNAAR